MAVTTTLQPDETASFDTYIDSHDETPYPGGLAVLSIGHHRDRAKRTIIRWDLTTISSLQPRITSATMTLVEHDNKCSVNQVVLAYRITQSSTTEAATWDTFDLTGLWITPGGDYSTDIVSTGTMFASGGDLVFDDAGMAALVQDAIDNRSGYLYMVVATQEEIDASNLGGFNLAAYETASTATAADRPKLELTYEVVTHWTGGAGDGDLDTADNWSNGVPAAGYRVLFSTGSDYISDGSITGGVVCVGPKFHGGIGISPNNAPAIVPSAIQITADVISLQSGVAKISLDSLNSDAAIYVMDSPPIATTMRLTGSANHLVVGRTRAKHTFNVDTPNLSAFPISSVGFCRFVMGSAFDGNVKAAGNNTRVELTTAGGTDAFIHSTRGARVETAESGTSGFLLVGGGGEVGFNCSEINTELGRYTATDSFAPDDSHYYDWFGGSLDYDGNTVIVGAPHKYENAGDCAYVFTSQAGTWIQEAELVADGSEELGHNFGAAVAIDGNTAAVSAPEYPVFPMGRVHIFTRSGTTWTEQCVLQDGEYTHSVFGCALALCDGTLLVGAKAEGDIYNQEGAVYVYTGSGASWDEQAMLTAGDGDSGDLFGASVVLYGDTAVIGAPGDDTSTGAAYVFTRSGGAWTQQAKLTASDAATGDTFGRSVAIYGDTAVISAHEDNTSTGAAYVFTRSGGAWTQQAKLTASDFSTANDFGRGVAIEGDTVVVRATKGNGDLFYIFTRSDGTWSERTKGSVPLAGQTAFSSNQTRIVGGIVALGCPTGPKMVGCVYSYSESAGVWTQDQKVEIDGGGHGEYFGRSVSALGSRMVSGRPGDDGTKGAAHVYLYDLVTSTWSLEASLVAGDASEHANFGQSVAVSSSTVIVGADGYSHDAGAAYVFTRSGVTWTQQAKLTASDAASEDLGGWSVAYDTTLGDTAVIGAPGDDSSTGAAYVFTRSGGTWTQQAKLTASDAATGDMFGYSVRIDDGTIVVGAPEAAGAYMFTGSGASWTQEQKITPSESGLAFGCAVDILGDAAVIGARESASAGAAFVFTRTAGTWTEQEILTASDGSGGDDFGHAVSYTDGAIIVGAPGDSLGEGSAYVFVGSGASWLQQEKIVSSEETVAQFGYSVAIDKTLLDPDYNAVVGAHMDYPLTGGRAYILTLGQVGGAIVMDGTFDCAENPNGDANIGGQLSVYYPGDAQLDSTTGGVGFSIGAIELYGGDFSVGSDTTAEVY